MYPILVAGAACVWAAALAAVTSAKASKSGLARKSTRIITPGLEELSEFEVELPTGCGTPTRIHFVESIPDIHSQRSERAEGTRPKSRTSEQARWIKLAWLVPNIAAFEESVQVERLIDPEAQLRRSDEESVSERPRQCLGLVAKRVVAVRGNRELIVSAERLAVLSAAQGKRLGIEERTSAAEYCSCARAESGDEDHRLRPQDRATDASDR